MNFVLNAQVIEMPQKVKKIAMNVAEVPVKDQEDPGGLGKKRPENLKWCSAQIDCEILHTVRFT